MPPLNCNHAVSMWRGRYFVLLNKIFSVPQLLVAEYSIGLCKHHLLTRYKVTNVTVTVTITVVTTLLCDATYHTPKMPKAQLCNKYELDVKGRRNIHLQKLATYNTDNHQFA